MEFLLEVVLAEVLAILAQLAITRLLTWLCDHAGPVRAVLPVG